MTQEELWKHMNAWEEAGNKIKKKKVLKRVIPNKVLAGEVSNHNEADWDLLTDIASFISTDEHEFFSRISSIKYKE
jgi:hypothetical protein